jgi:hypothetical protein
MDNAIMPNQSVNGYIKINTKNNGCSDFFDKLFSAVDIGPNNDIFD